MPIVANTTLLPATAKSNTRTVAVTVTAILLLALASIGAVMWKVRTGQATNNRIPEHATVPAVQNPAFNANIAAAGGSVLYAVPMETVTGGGSGEYLTPLAQNPEYCVVQTSPTSPTGDDVSSD